MDESEFKGTVTGEVRWAMNGAYCYFHPHDLPYDWMCSRESMNRMRDASVELARLDGMLRFIDSETIRMLTEMGVRKIVLMDTEFTEGYLNDHQKERLSLIMREAVRKPPSISR